MEGASFCRLYRDPHRGFQGTPTTTMIAEALRSAATKRAGKRSESGWRTSLAAFPGISVSLLPVGVCPTCWPLYAGILSALGVGFLLQASYLLPLTAVFLLIAVGGLAYKAPSRRGYGPFTLGVAASAAVIAGKFIFEASAVVYSGVVLLLSASLWNAWPRKTTDTGGGGRPACAPRRTGADRGPTEGDPEERRSVMNAKRTIEVFSAGCPACRETIDLVNRLACSSCEISVLDMNDPQVAKRAKELGIRCMPAVVIDGKLADCCAGCGPDQETLRSAGVDNP